MTTNEKNEADLNKRSSQLKRVQTQFDKNEYRSAITRARILLERGVPDAYFLVMNACVKLKDVKTAERIVKLALKRNIQKDYLAKILLDVYNEAEEFNKYDKLYANLKIMSAEEALRSITS